MRIIAVLSLFLVALPAVAATRYVVTVEEGAETEQGPRRSYLVDGERWRVDILDETTEPRSWDAMIGTADGLIGLDHQRRAWFPMGDGKSGQVIRGQRDWEVPMSRQSVAVGMTSEFHEPVASDQIAGRDALRHEVRLRTTMRGSIWGERLDAKVSATLRLWTIEGVPGVPPELDLRTVHTGVPNLDSWLRSELEKIPGFVAKREIIVVRKLDMGEATSSRSLVSIDDIELETQAPGDAFDIPTGYTESAPQIGAPGS